MKRKAEVELRMIIWSEENELLSKLLRLRDESDVMKGYILYIFLSFSRRSVARACDRRRWEMLICMNYISQKNLNKAVKHVFY